MSQIPQQALYPDDPRTEVQPFIPRDGVQVALDVGCGSGGFGRTLRSTLGPSAHIEGIDAVEANVTMSKARDAYDHVYQGYFPEELRQLGVNQKYDLISFLDVLEHMFDPWEALKATRKYLSPTGVVLAAIPNIQTWRVIRDLIHGRWEYTDTGILDRTHVRFFTKSTMVEMFQSAGYSVDGCFGINSQLPTYWPPRRSINRRTLSDMKWLPKVIPDSRWLQYVVVARQEPIGVGMSVMYPDNGI